MPSSPPAFTLNNGVKLPPSGFACSRHHEVTQQRSRRRYVGYRMIDTAAAYLNEPEVGAAIKVSGIKRSGLSSRPSSGSATTATTPRCMRFDVSTRKLRVDTVDLYLLHQPLPQDFDATVDAYRAAERLLEEGRARAIGVSNFSPAHLEIFLPRINIVPAVNQVEVHPYYNQPVLRAAHRRLGIVTQAWSPLGGVYVYRPSDPDAPKNALADPVVTDLAVKYGKSAAQVVLRWHLDSGRSAIPKSVRPERIAENLDVFDFALTADEIARIDGLDTGVRGGPNQDEMDFRTFDRTIPE